MLLIVRIKDKLFNRKNEVEVESIKGDLPLEDINPDNVFVNDELEFTNNQGDFGTNAKERIKQVASEVGGGTQLYKHILTLTLDEDNVGMLKVITTTNEPLGTSSGWAVNVVSILGSNMNYGEDLCGPIYDLEVTTPLDHVSFKVSENQVFNSSNDELTINEVITKL